MESNLPVLADLARQLAETEDPAQAAGIKGAPCRLPQDHLRGQIIDPALVVRAFVGPVPPELIILDKLRMLPIHLLPLGAAHDPRTEHSNRAQADCRSPRQSGRAGLPAFVSKFGRLPQASEPPASR